MSDVQTVERSITIDAPPSAIYPHLADFRQWSSWSPWDELDPDQQRTYSGAESGLGAKYAWSGNRKVGQGRMEITGVEENSRVELDLEFLKPFKSQNTTVFALEPVGDSTKVTWTMKAPKTLMSRIMSIFKTLDAMVGPDFEKGLAKLKALAEADA